MNKKLNEIDYTPLLELNSWTKSIRSVVNINPIVSVALVVILTLLSIYYLRLSTLYLFMFASIYISYKRSTYKNIIWQNFAHENGWPLTRAVAINPVYIPPGIYALGRKPKLGDIVHAQFEGRECEVYMYEFITGSGRYKETHYYTIVKVKLLRHFPHIILDSKKSRALENRGDAVHMARLEGNFNKYFSLYFRKDDQINALSIITPDVMRTLIDFNTNHDIEIIGKSLFFMSHTDQRNVNALPSLFQSVDALADEINHKATTIHYKPDQAEQERIMTAITSQYFQSGDRAISSIWKTLFVALLIAFVTFTLILVTVSAFYSKY